MPSQCAAPMAFPVRISWETALHTLPDKAVGGFYFGQVMPADGVPEGVVPLEMPVLSASAVSGYETWMSGADVSFREEGRIRFVTNGQAVFGYVSLPESDDTCLEALTYTAYIDVLQFVRELGCGHLWRLWNYFPGINALNSGLERYRSFNVGRQRAYDVAADLLAAGMPAASAIGVRHGDLSVAFLAGKQPAQFIENPRQVSAFNYPERYGPRSPAFSRAGLVQWGQGWLLLVSGTASIVGHESLHVDDLRAQTLTSLENVRLVVQEAEKRAMHGFPLHEMLFRVYVRNEPDQLSVQRGFAEFFAGASMPGDVHYVLGDICRRDLLVEIEASGCFA